MKSTHSLVAILFLLTGLIFACAPSPAPIPTATPDRRREKAIETATGGCRRPHLVLVGEPQNIKSKLATLRESEELPWDWGETPQDGMSTDTMVWLVQMEGQMQLVGGPEPTKARDTLATTPVSSQPFWGTCAVVLDANSGKIMSIRNYR